MDLWNTLIINPMVNSLLFLYGLLFHNLTLTIVVFTIIIRAITFPLTYQSQKSQKKMAEMQNSPEWKHVQEKYAKDKEKLMAEQAKLWQAAGYNPLAGCLPLFLQFPILIGMYQAITNAIAASPIQLYNLSTHLYNFLPGINNLVPLDNTFLWLNLGLPDPYFLMPILVAATSWVQSKVMTPPPSTDPQAAQTTQQMALMSTVMFAWFSLSFASGLSIYFIVGNILGIIQYGMTNPLRWDKIFDLGLMPAPAVETKGAGAKKSKR